MAACTQSARYHKLHRWLESARVDVHQAAEAQEPVLALMQSVALVFSSALASGHSRK